MSDYPKVVALDLDYTVWRGYLDPNTWGKGWNAARPQEDNIEGVRDDLIRDKSNSNNQLQLYPDVAGIIGDIIKHNAKLAIVSRNRSRAMTDRALWYLKVWHPHKNRMVSITDVVQLDEVYDQSKDHHFIAIKNYTGIDYQDMILFDDENRNNEVEIKIGVTFKPCRLVQGLTWNNYNEGIAMWRRNKSLHKSFTPVSIAGKFPTRSFFVGYCGTTTTTFQRLSQGQRRIDQTRPARWGYGLYVADNPRMAKFFADSVSAGPGRPVTVVCRIYARDVDAFMGVPKIWVPEKDELQTNNIGAGHNERDIGDSQVNRDDWARDRGVSKPYILFSKHYKMPGMPIPDNTRFNEMAIYPQLQDALFFAHAMQPSEVEQDMQAWDRGWLGMRYDKSIRSWGIKVPWETSSDIQSHFETLT